MKHDLAKEALVKVLLDMFEEIVRNKIDSDELDLQKFIEDCADELREKAPLLGDTSQVN
jgi:hypothetical protein